MKTLALKRPDVKRPAITRPAMPRPEGVVDVRKVKSAAGGEGPAQLTWVIAYSERILPGSPGHEAIRAFAGTLKAPRNVEQSVMLLPVMARAAPPAEARPPAPPAQPPKKARVKRRAKARAKLRAKVQSKRAKTHAKAKTKPTPRKPARRPTRRRIAATTTGARSKSSA